METILQWGMDCIRLAQTYANPPLNACMRIITELGSATAYLILIPLIYWCVDEKKGMRLGTMVLISVCINLSLKFLLDQPRPFFEGYDPSLGMISERLGGFPSGHAQNSLVMWAIIASWGKRKWCFGIATFICLLIGFSRIYLGVHFPTDVFGGWIIGGLLLCVYFLYDKRIEALLETGGFRAGMIASATLAFIMILYRPGAELLMPGGMMIGLGAGYCLNRKYIGFRSSIFFANTGERQYIKYLILLARFIMGIAFMMLILTVLGKLFPQAPQTGNYDLFHFIRFALAALWVSAGAPWLFCKIRLASVPQTEEEQRQ